MLDRINVSDRKGFMLLAQGVNLNGFIGSSSTIRRDRIKKRNEIAQKMNEKFSKQNMITVHFDSKILKSLIGDCKVNRVAVVITAPQIDEYQLLAIPTSDSGKGKDESDVIYETLEK